MLTFAALAALGALSAHALPSSPGVCQPLASIAFKNAPVAAPGLRATIIQTNLAEPRGMRIDASDNLLVVERYVGVSALTYRNDSTCAGWEKRVVINSPDIGDVAQLEHGIEIGPGKGLNQYLYASTSESVYRWEYDPRNAVVIGSPVQIAWNMSNIGAILPGE
jgi:hypothetical protein